MNYSTTNTYEMKREIVTFSKKVSESVNKRIKKIDIFSILCIILLEMKKRDTVHPVLLISFSKFWGTP